MSAKIIPMFDFNTAPRQNHTPQITIDPEVEFRSHLAGQGYFPNEIIADGEIHRFKSPEDKGAKQSAWYLLFENAPHVGLFGDWKTDHGGTWSPVPEFEMSYEDTTAYRQRIDAAKAKRDIEQEKRHNTARIKAQDTWSKAVPATEHPYLSDKQVKSYGLKIHNGKLVVPIMDYAGVINSLEFINSDGDKLFLPGGRKKGLFYTIPGDEKIVICEGYSTGASVHEATGFTVIVAMDAGNLLPVAEAWRKSNPTAEIIIAGDNDLSGVGQDKANVAGKSISARVVIPTKAGSDWNDMACLNGMQTVNSAFVQNSYRTTITDWGIEAYSGLAPKRMWLIEKTIPSSALTILSAQGDAGKGMLLLDLGLKIAGGDINTETYKVEALGNIVLSFGAVVILTAEDDKDEMHRRIESILNGRKLQYPIYIVPLPNAGGVMPFVVPGRNGPEVSQLWHESYAQLTSIPNLKLIVVDPLASFVMADVNADPAVGAFTTGLFASLATETGAAVIVAHHLAKTKSKISTPEDARALVRGSTAIVDGARSVYVLWGADEKDSKMKCKHLGIPWQRNRIFFGCLVKSNGPGDRNIKTYARNDSGLLQPVDVKIKQAASEDKEVMLDMLVQDIQYFAEARHPFSKTGGNGIWEQRFDLNPAFLEVSKHKLQGYVDILKGQKRVVAVAPKGSKNKTYLDVPDGPFTHEETEILTGDRPKRW